MSKSIVGMIFLLVAAMNIRWAAQIFKLKKKGGTLEERADYEKQAKRLSRISAISYFVMSIVFLVFIFGSKK